MMIDCGFGSIDETKESQEILYKKQIQKLNEIISKQKEEIDFLRKNIANIKDWAELDIDEDGVPIV